MIISNAVLNVLPQDQRDALTVKMGQMLNPGGRMFVNVRKNDVMTAKSKVVIDEDNWEVYISDSGSYQKGFRQNEIVAYMQDALGDDFIVEPTKKFGGMSVIVTRKAEAKYSKNTTDSTNTALDNYTEKQYNEKGWAIVNNVLNGTELKQMYSAIADAKKTKAHKYRYTPDGELIISTGQKSESLDHIVFVSGTYENPIITKIYQYIGEEETPYKGNLFEEVQVYEETGLPDALKIISGYAGDEYFTVITRRDFETYSEKRQARLRADRNIGSGTENTEYSQNKRGSGAEDTDSVKKSLQTTDAEYMVAVERGDMETAQRMVEEAAKKAGYTAKVFHGTENGKGFVYHYFRQNSLLFNGENNTCIV